MYPRDMKYLRSSYEDVTNKNYGYLLIDVQPDTSDRFRLWTTIFHCKEVQPSLKTNQLLGNCKKNLINSTCECTLNVLHGSIQPQSSSSSCHQTSVFHLSMHFFAVSLNLLRSSNEQGCSRRVHCIMCAVFSVARPHSQVVSPS